MLTIQQAINHPDLTFLAMEDVAIDPHIRPYLSERWRWACGLSDQSDAALIAVADEELASVELQVHLHLPLDEFAHWYRTIGWDLGYGTVTDPTATDDGQEDRRGLAVLVRLLSTPAWHDAGPTVSRVSAEGVDALLAALDREDDLTGQAVA